MIRLVLLMMASAFVLSTAAYSFAGRRYVGTAAACAFQGSANNNAIQTSRRKCQQGRLDGLLLCSKRRQRRQQLSSSASASPQQPRTDEDKQKSNNSNNQLTITNVGTLEHRSSYHAPVMWRDCVDALMDCERARSRLETNDTEQESLPLDIEKKQESVVFVDGTLGGGGHSSALLQSLRPGDVVIGCDVDAAALNTASQRLVSYLGSQHKTLPLFVPIQSNFCELASVLPKLNHPVHKKQRLLPNGLVDGILLDLGVSSHQIDTATRGFAFMKDGPLDMRMSTDLGFIAADVCNEYDEEQLRHLLKTYGDEPRARSIARSIVKHRPLSTTRHLVQAVAAVTPEFNRKSKRMGRTATLARVFQSIRIVVNEEDKVLEKALEVMCPTLLRPGGRLAVLSYHSMEDRAAKRMMRDGAVHPTPLSHQKDIYGNLVGAPRPFRTMGKARKASPEETEANPRARSATLRVAERIAATN